MSKSYSWVGCGEYEDIKYDKFDGIAKKDYYAIASWIKDNVLFDQLILEFKTTGTGNPWIHISYIKGDNAKINSVSSTDPNIHKAYQDESTFYIDNFTHNISLANENVLIQ